MIHYLLHTSILLALSFLFYSVFLKKETFHSLNRYFLIAAFFASMLIPLVAIPPSLSFNTAVAENSPINSTPNTPVTPSSNTLDKAVMPLEKISTPSTPLVTKEKSTFIQAVKKWDMSKIVWVVYLLGTSVFILTFLIQFVILLLKKRNLEKIKDGKFTIYELEDNSSPFSFFHWIFINPSIYEPDTFDQILEHEKIHVSQSHYIDKLIAELAVILFWYNPFAWLYRKAITNNLEFLTDSEILETGTEPESYQMSLLRVSVPQHPLSLTTNYNQSFLEQRIKMMNERKSSAQSSWKYLLAIPLILLSMASLNAVQIAEQEPQVVQKNQKSNPDKNSRMAYENENQYENQKNLLHQDNKGINTTESNTINTTSSTDIPFNLDKIVSDAVKTGITQYSESNVEANSENDHLNSMIHDVRPGHWKASINGKKVCFVLSPITKTNVKWTTSTCFMKSNLGNLPFDDEGSFIAKRDQGELILVGAFDGLNGQGTFDFEPNKDYNSYLKSKNIGSASDHELLLMFLNGLDREMIEFLISSGYKLNVDELIEIGIHTNSLEELKSFEKVLMRLDIKERKVNRLVEMAIHNVHYEYVDDMLRQGLSDLSLNKLIEAKIHGVDEQYVQELSDAGYKDLPIRRIIEFRIHGVSTAEMSEIKDMGYDNIPSDKLVEFQIHGVTPDFIKGFKEIGYKDLSPNRLVEFAIHGVSPDEVQQMQKAGYKDISASKLVEFAIHGVDSEFLKEFADIGYNDIGTSKLVEFAIHGVTPSFVKRMKDIGYDEISSSKLVEMRIHGVNPDFIKEVKSMGLNDLSINKIIEFAIHGVDSDYVNSLQSVGFKNLSTQDLIDGKIHGVSGNYYKELKELNVEGLSFNKLVEGRIHNVSTDFVKRARKKGYNPKSMSDYIELKIHGF